MGRPGKSRSGLPPNTRKCRACGNSKSTIEFVGESKVCRPCAAEAQRRACEESREENDRPLPVGW